MEGVRPKRLLCQLNQTAVGTRQYMYESRYDARRSFVGCFKAMAEDLNPNELLPWCVQRGILSPQEMEEITVKETRLDKNLYFLCVIHRKATVDVDVLDKFTEILTSINTSSMAGCLDHIIEGLKATPSVLIRENNREQPSEDIHHWYELLRVLYPTICASVDIKHILPELISEEVITVTQCEEVLSVNVREQRTALLLNMLLERREGDLLRIRRFLVNQSTYQSNCKF